MREIMHYLTRIVGGLTVLIALASCSDGSVAGVAANKVYFGMQEQSVPLLAGKTTHGSVMLINDSDNAIDNISYQAIVNGSDELKNQVLIESNSCSKILAHSSCSVPFAVSIATENMMSGSAVVVASYTNQQQQKVNQSTIVEYGVSHDGRVSLSAGPILPTLNPKQDTTYSATLYVVNPESSDYVVQNLITSSADSQLINSGALAGTTIAANSVAALPIEVNTSVDKINLQLALNSPALNDSLILNTSLTAITPVGNGAILVSGTLPVIYSDNTLNASFTIYNAGNATATLSSIAAGSGFSVVSGSSTCSTIAPSNTLAPNSSCTIALTISQNYSGSADLSVNYTGGTSAGTTTLTQNVQWIYAYEPNISVTSTLSQYSVYTPTSSSGTVTITNYTKYPFTITNIQSIPIAGMGNAAATTTGSCTGVVLNVNNPSCTTTLNVTGVGQMTLTATGTYLDKDGNQHTYTGQAFNLANVYAAGTWNPWGTESQNSISTFTYSSFESQYRADFVAQMAISPVNSQPYILLGQQFMIPGIPSSCTGCFNFGVFTYNGINWTQVGQLIPMTGSLTSGQSEIGYIAFNPVTKVLWLALWQASDPNIYFYTYNASANQWVSAAPTIPLPSAAVKTTTNRTFGIAFDNSGNLYVVNPKSVSPYQMIVESLPNGGNTWITMGTALTSGPGANGFKVAAIAINPLDQTPWVVYYDYSSTSPSTSPVYVKRWNGSSFVQVGATSLYTSTSSTTNSVALSMAFNPKNNLPVVVGLSSKTTSPGIYNAVAESYDGISGWSYLGSSATNGFIPQTARQISVLFRADGTLFATAGTGSNSSIPVVDVYNTTTNTWVTSGPNSGFTMQTLYPSVFSNNNPIAVSLGFGANNESIILYQGNASGALDVGPTTFVDVFHQ